MIYNWQQKDWTQFRYNENQVLDAALDYTAKAGLVQGMLHALPDNVEMEVDISSLVAEALKTSEIEGEYIGRDDLISSVRNQLGLNAVPEKVKDRRADGVVKMMLRMRSTFAQPLSAEELFFWHELLMEGNRYINAGTWRTSSEPMQVVSGAAGREQVHFEAPPASQVAEEMNKFIEWYNDTAPRGKKAMHFAPVRSALAHLYFESIHPFEDGNGRIGRALSEKVLSKHAGRPVILSLSQVIESDKKTYYNSLKSAQRSNEVTGWVRYFIGVISSAREHAERQIDFIVRKTHFFDRFREKFTPRQLKVIGKILDQGPAGFEGGMSARKYMSIAKTSKATATRDLHDLCLLGVLTPLGEGRNRSYTLKL